MPEPFQAGPQREFRKKEVGVLARLALENAVEKAVT
jgi:hypothetical protein